MRLTATYRNWGFGMCFLYLRNVKKFLWNDKRVYRIYRELELNLRIKPKKRITREKPAPLKVPTSINETWSMDFMHDGLNNGKSYRLLNVIDDFNRQGLGMEVDVSLPSERVIRTLERIIEWRGKPKIIRCDNGPEYISEKLKAWAQKKGFGIISNRASLSRMLMWNASIAPCDTIGLIKKSFMTSRRYKKKQPNGSGTTTTSGLIWLSVSSPLCRN